MLDVIHYLFEDDLLVSTAEESDAKSEVRSVIYRQLYGTTYKYGTSSSGKRYNYSEDNLPRDGYVADIDIKPFDPDKDDPLKKKAPTKAYTPAMEPNVDSTLPFGMNVLPPESH
jgi:hypothetical protein